MKILVCIKQVPESNKVEVDPVTGVLKRDGAASKMNPYDLYALETAFRIREEVGHFHGTAAGAAGDPRGICDGRGRRNAFIGSQIWRCGCTGDQLYTCSGHQELRRF
jgi:hypothetical protein